MKLTTGRLVNGSSCGEIDMVIKDLDLEPKKETLLDVVGTSGCHFEVLQSFPVERIEQVLPMEERHVCNWVIKRGQLSKMHNLRLSRSNHLG
ncbi:hypothetical protein Tco_0898573 [Tanacetum coccineum]